jgi:hypothetical protein
LFLFVFVCFCCFRGLRVRSWLARHWLLRAVQGRSLWSELLRAVCVHQQRHLSSSVRPMPMSAWLYRTALSVWYVGVLVCFVRACSGSCACSCWCVLVYLLILIIVQSGGLPNRRSRFDPRHGRPLYIWMYTPAFWVCFGGDIAL